MIEIIERNLNTDRPTVFRKKDCRTIDDHIELLLAVKKEYGNIPIAIPSDTEGYGEDVQVWLGPISTIMASNGKEIEW